MFVAAIKQICYVQLQAYVRLLGIKKNGLEEALSLFATIAIMNMPRRHRKGFMALHALLQQHYFSLPY